MKFRKKPVVIEATQWFNHGDHPAVTAFFTHDPQQFKYGWVETLEGGHIVTPGDWIITGVKGEHYPCKPDIFEATYEKGGVMNKEQIIRWAHEAGAHFDHMTWVERDLAPVFQRFAELVAAHERERFAEECIDLVAFYGGPVDLEAAIRARSE